MVFQFELMNVDGAEVNKWTDQRFSLKDLKQIMSRWQVGMYQQAWNSLFWNNHDQPRCVSRFGDTSSPLCHEKFSKNVGDMFTYDARDTLYLSRGRIGDDKCTF